MALITSIEAARVGAENDGFAVAAYYERCDMGTGRWHRGSMGGEVP